MTSVVLNVMRPLKITLPLALGLLISVQDVVASEATPNAKIIKCGLAFTKPGFVSVDAFVESVNLRKGIWGELLMPDDFPEYENPLQFRRPLSESAWSDGVVVIHQTRNSAIVFADNKANRTAPFCAVVFLLAKEGRRFHVVDFIRRATGYESYSAIAKPKVLNLQSGGFLHFYFTEFLGGRKWDFDTDEFYIVRHNKFRRTLLLKNVSAYLSPADAYREFTQDADVHVNRGRLLLTVKRSWSMDEKPETQQTLNVAFRWNSRQLQFTSPRAATLMLKEPNSWSGDGLPSPPSGDH